MTERMQVSLTINDEQRQLTLDPARTLLDVLRNDLGLTGTKCGCNQGVCGACTVLVNGEAMLSCLLLPVMLEQKSILTIEGLIAGAELHPLQQAFIAHGALQCGFCTPGMILSAKALLDSNPTPTVNEIRHALSGNICRCTGYVKIVEAIVALTKGDHHD